MPGTGNTATWNGEVVALSSGLKFNVVGLTPVVGTFEANMSGKEIYVIYDTTNFLASAYVAKAVYIADPAESGTGSGVTPPSTGTFVPTSIAGYEVNTTTKQVYVAASTTTSLGAMASAWTTYGVLTITEGGVTSVVNAANAETVASAIIRGAVVTITDASAAYTVVIVK